MTTVKKLRRSRLNKIIGGVAGGLGEYFDTDPVFFRIGFVALSFIFGNGLLIYLLAWIFLKQEGPMLTQNNTSPL